MLPKLLQEVTISPNCQIDWFLSLFNVKQYFANSVFATFTPFRPSQTVTRAELMAVLRKAIQYADEGGGISALINKQQAIVFSDIS
ncbi:MAG: hypothetical protein KME50_29545 [Nostoc desertorum CM1-VF14]|nr:hypothetical protein [Nostoc desertorum CM1-VF14]